MSQARLEITVDGMTCQGCVRTVQKKLMSVAGVKEAQVDLTASRAVVEYDDSAATPEKLISAVEQVGFHAART